MGLKPELSDVEAVSGFNPDGVLHDGAAGDTAGDTAGARRNDGENTDEPPFFEPLSINGIPIETREAFRHWYGQKFRTTNTILAPFVGGRLKALDISDNDQALIDAADSLYDHALKKEWVWLLKKGGGLMSVVEANGGLFFAIVTDAKAEIAARIAEAEAAQAYQETGDTSGGGDGGNDARSQADLDRNANGRKRDAEGRIVY